MWIFLEVMIVLQCVHSLQITSVRIPEVLLYGSRGPLTLDCDFVTDNVTGLVVQWFLNGRENLVYQWIPPRLPQALGVLRGKLDLSYKASNNPYTWHRALRVRNPEPELTGNYTCVVSTSLSEDYRTKPMTIFVPEGRFDMMLDQFEDDYLNIICKAEGLYPRPELTILFAGRPLEVKSSVYLINGRYTVVTSAGMMADTLPPTAEVKCNLLVPLVNYNKTERKTFVRDAHVVSNESATSNTHSLQNIGHKNEMKLFLVTAITLYAMIQIM